MKINILYTTVASQEQAETLAHDAVTAKRAACVNVFPQGLSIYQWEGKLLKEQEQGLIFKTTLEKKEELRSWILKNHPYTQPAILQWDVDTTKEFFEFVASFGSRP